MRRLRAEPLLQTWAVLVLLSLLGTTLSLGLSGALPPELIGIAILALGFAKARLILLRYLGLERASFWRGGGVAAIAVTTLILAGLYLAG